MATGHYIRRTRGSNKAELHCAVDHSRDQSYFLFSTTNEQLEYLRFPLGDLASKKETRLLAKKFNLNVADKPDSQDICFVPNGNYASVIEKLRPEAMDPGEILDHQGNFIGTHDGVINYTIGQRRGLGIGGLDEPLYVIKLDVESKKVIVGPKALLKTTHVPLAQVNWLGDTPIHNKKEWNVSVKVRSTRPPSEAILRPANDHLASVELVTPEEGVSPGQACVFYERTGSRVLGGGWITR
jgi:tRNA-specific 2-thiouridylase